jgi:phosphatidylglycerophosphatase A
MQKIFLTLFYSGLSKYAPGTMGSIVALFMALSILQFLPISNLFAFSIIIFFIAIKQINKYEKINKTHDSKEIVIDELVGMWIALVVCGIGIDGNMDSNDYIKSFLAFLAFRYFDIFKPSIIGRIDKKVKGGLGVMGDDVLAGLFAGILVNVGYVGYEKLVDYGYIIL